MTSFSLIFAPLLALQGVGAAPLAIENDTPESWTVEYPRLIEGYVAEYRRCLTGQMRNITGRSEFRKPASRRCGRVRRTNPKRRRNYPMPPSPGAADTPTSRPPMCATSSIMSAASTSLAGPTSTTSLPTFNAPRRRAQAQYQAERPKGLVLELHDASVVKARTDATAAAAEAAYEQRQEANSASN